MASIHRPQTRSIVVKALFSADEYLAFDQACAANDASHSKTLRDLAKSWITRQTNDRQRAGKLEWPGAGQNMAKFLPGHGRITRRPFRQLN